MAQSSLAGIRTASDDGIWLADGNAVVALRSVHEENCQLLLLTWGMDAAIARQSTWYPRDSVAVKRGG
jgi:hypothetical protein